MRPADAVLRIRRLRVSFGGVVALNLDSLDIAGVAGIGALLMGPNGAGKTTLLNALTGYARCERSAEVNLSQAPASRNLAGASRPSIVRAGLVRTFQKPTVFPSLSVKECIVLALVLGSGRSIWRRSLASIAARPSGSDAVLLDAVVRLVGIEGAVSAQPRDLPLHMLRRVELARCLATQPRLLMLDEPSAGSDDNEKEWLARTLLVELPAMVCALRSSRAYRYEHVTSCVVTHDLRLATLLSGQDQPVVHLLDQGRLRESGTLQQLIASPTLRAAYFGEA